jgi:ABC-type sugar transport system ATPase subunit
MVYVTHDQVEAMTLADKIVVLNAGRIEQVGSPIELYNAPANRFVAQFIGSPRMNFLDGEIRSDNGRRELLVGTARIALSGDIGATASGPVGVGLRSEHLLIGGGTPLFEAVVGVAERLGSETIAYLDAAGGGEPIAVKAPASYEPRPGERVQVGVSDGLIHLFAADGAAIGRVRAVPAGAA